MKNACQSTGVSRILFDILAYLADHPEAGDTVEGIAQWWLLDQRIRQKIPEIEKALTALVDKGFVLKQSISNGRPCYRINRRKHKQIKAFLDKRRKYPNCNTGN